MTRPTPFGPLPLVRFGIAACALFLAVEAPALDISWDDHSGVDSNWNTPENWFIDTVPMTGDTAVFDLGAAPAVIDGDVPTIDELRFVGNSGAVEQSAGTLNITGQFRMGVGTTADSSYSLTGGQVNAGQYFVGETTGAANTVTISGNGVLRQSDVAVPTAQENWSRIGEQGDAIFNLSGNGLASFDGARVMVGAGAPSTTRVNQDGGIFEVRRGKIIIADSSPDTVYNISGGIMRTFEAVPPDGTGAGGEGANLTIGAWDNSHGQLNVSGTAQVNIVENIIVGDGQSTVPSRGTITQTNGTVTAANVNLGTSLMGTAIYNMSGGSLDVDQVLRVGINTNTTENAHFTQTAGDVTFRRLFVAENAGSLGTVDLQGGNLIQDTIPNETDNWSHIGLNGIGNFNISGGLASFHTRTQLGTSVTGEGTVTQTGGIFEVTEGDVIIGDSGTATYNISSGTLRTVGAGTIAVANWNDSNAQLNISGDAQVISAGNLTVGQVDDGNFSSTGVVTQSGDSHVQIAGDILMGVSMSDDATTPSGTYRLQGGTLDMTGGSITKEAGTAVFEMTGGRLQDLAAFSLGDFNQVGGVLAPGAAGSTGATTFIGSFSLGALATLELSIPDAFTSDQIFDNAGLTLLGSLSIVDDPIGLALGSTYLIIDNNDLNTNPVIGVFAGLPEGADLTSAAGNIFRVSYVAGDGNDVSLLVVPEPATGALLLGSMGLFALRRRRRV
ncbi:MAG: PEP-CTERM sorting domain-containing protein [Chthoniobacteraceae bacterium]